VESETFQKVKQIIIDKLHPDDESKIVPEARFTTDLGADSLDLVELIIAFEEEFGGTISDEQARQIQTVGQAVEFLEGAKTSS
jgi:acyl carrier protein